MEKSTQFSTFLELQEGSSVAPVAQPNLGHARAVQTARKNTTTSSTSGGSGGGRGHGGRGGQDGTSGERSSRRFSFAQSFLRMASHDTRGSTSSSSHQIGAESGSQGSSSQPTADGLASGSYDFIISSFLILYYPIMNYLTKKLNIFISFVKPSS